MDGNGAGDGASVFAHRVSTARWCFSSVFRRVPHVFHGEKFSGAPRDGYDGPDRTFCARATAWTRCRRIGWVGRSCIPLSAAAARRVQCSLAPAKGRAGKREPAGSSRRELPVPRLPGPKGRGAVAKPVARALVREVQAPLRKPGRAGRAARLGADQVEAEPICAAAGQAEGLSDRDRGVDSGQGHYTGEPPVHLQGASSPALGVRQPMRCGAPQTGFVAPAGAPRGPMRAGLIPPKQARVGVSSVRTVDAGAPGRAARRALLRPQAHPQGVRRRPGFSRLG